MPNIFITGIAGFIGSALAHSLVKDGHNVWGIDSFNDYYDVDLKRARAANLNRAGVYVEEMELSVAKTFYLSDALTTFVSDPDPNLLGRALKADVVVHLAAYAGVRHSTEHTDLYVQNNIVGTQRLIDACVARGIKKVVYASTSCVMAGNPLPWKEDAPVGHQLNPYGWTKRVNECQFINSKIENVIGLRFFTVYGPWGRPDMALFTFTENMKKGLPIQAFNHGKMKRDFTYIDDIVQGIKIVLYKDLPRGEIYNIGRGEQVDLMEFIGEIGRELGVRPKIEFVDRHPADTLETWSDCSKLKALGYDPKTSITQGVQDFIGWHNIYYRS